MEQYYKVPAKVWDVLKQSPEEIHAYVAIVAHARYEKDEYVFSGYSHRKLAKLWRWPCHKKVARFFKKLENEGILVPHPCPTDAPRYTLILHAKNTTTPQPCPTDAPHNLDTKILQGKDTTYLIDEDWYPPPSAVKALEVMGYSKQQIATQRDKFVDWMLEKKVMKRPQAWPRLFKRFFDNVTPKHSKKDEDSGYIF